MRLTVWRPDITLCSLKCESNLLPENCRNQAIRVGQFSVQIPGHFSVQINIRISIELKQ